MDELSLTNGYNPLGRSYLIFGFKAVTLVIAKKHRKAYPLFPVTLNKVLIDALKQDGVDKNH